MSERRKSKRPAEYRFISTPGFPNVQRAVRMLAIADGHAMVRVKGCFPFVIEEHIWATADPVNQEGK